MHKMAPGAHFLDRLNHGPCERMPLAQCLCISQRVFLGQVSPVKWHMFFPPWKHTGDRIPDLSLVAQIEV